MVVRRSCLVLVLALAGVLVTPSLAGRDDIASASPAAVDPDADGDATVPREVVLDIVDGVFVELDLLRADLEDGLFGQPTVADHARIDDHQLWLEDFESRPASVTEGELDDFFASLDQLYADLFARSDGGAFDPSPPADPVIVEPAPATVAPATTLVPQPTAPAIAPATTVPATVPATTPATQPGTTLAQVDDPPGTMSASRATAVAVYREAAALLAWGAFDDDTQALTSLVELVGATGLGEASDPDRLFDQLEQHDETAATELDRLAALTPAVSEPTLLTVGPLGPSDMDALFDGEPISVSSSTYVAAIESLLFRNGRPLPNRATTGPQLAAVADELGEAIVEVDGEPVPATTTLAPTTTAAAAPTTAVPTTAAAPAGNLSSESDESGDDGTGDGSVLLLGSLAVLAVLAVGLVLVLVATRRRRTQPSSTDHVEWLDLIDIGRRLDTTTSLSDLERTAVQQAVQLTDADAGAFVRHLERDFVVSFQSTDDLLVADRLRDGVIDRVVGAGQDLRLVSSTEPAIRNLPISLLACPVLAGGAVVGAFILVRGADAPFTEDEQRLIGGLKPIVGGAIERLVLTEQARAEALVDGLTGIRNRRALDAAVAELTDERFSAVMVDLDHFKSVNDTHGHQAGDELLRAVAQRIADNIRPEDEVFRYGGEEFAILMRDTGTDVAAEVAERVRAALETVPFSIGPDQPSYRATASLGVAEGTDGRQVFASADAALYEAKTAGRNRVTLATTPSAG